METGTGKSSVTTTNPYEQALICFQYKLLF